jgi:hypothetical protein
MNKTILGALALFLSASPLSFALASPKSDFAAEAKFQAAAAMFAGKPQEACDKLEKSYDLNTVTDTDVLYIRGQCLQVLGRHGEAIPFYERILQINPNARAVRPHLVNAYNLSGNKDKMRDEMKEILRNDPPEDMAENIRSALASEQAQKPWFLSTEAGLIYDSNISAGPDSTQITAFGLPFTLGTASREQDSAGHVLSLSGGYRFDLQNNFGIVAQGSYDETNYFENNTFDSQYAGLSLGPVYRIGNWNLNANVTAGWRALDGDTYTRSLGTNARAAYAITPNLLLNASASYVDNNYKGTSRDGNSTYINLGTNYKLTETAMIYGGYFIGHDDTKDNKFQGVKHGPHAGIIIKPLPEVTTRLNLSFSNADYDGKDPAFGNQAREDNVYNASARISYDVGQFVHVDNLALNLNLGYTRADSNIKIYDYNRQTTTLSISKSW